MAVAICVLFADTPPAHAEFMERGFEVDYQVSRNGLDLGVTTRKLVPEGGGNYVFASKTRAEGLVALFFRDLVTETSHLRVNGNRVVPTSYRYSRSGGRKEREYALDFDWSQSELHLKPSDNTVLLAPGTQDLLSFSVQVMLNLQAGNQSFEMPIAGQKRVRQYRVDGVGTETLVTAIGPLSMVHLRADEIGRDTSYDLWCSPAHDYLPLRIIQTKPEETIELAVRAFRSPLPPKPGSPKQTPPT